MTVQCWGCAFGITAQGLVTPPFATKGDLLGACWECGVFVCSGHAERARLKGKWVCFPSVTKALSVSAGLDDLNQIPEDLVMTNSSDFGQQFPLLQRATSEHRSVWHEREDELAARALERFEQPITNTGLLADAAGVGEFLLPESPEAYRAFEDVEALEDAGLGHSAVLPGRIGLLVMELRNG
jgi:hypothetical protein